MDAKVSLMADKKSKIEQRSNSPLRIALLTSCYTPVLQIIAKQCPIDLLIHNQPIQQKHSILHRFKILAGRIFGMESDIIRWANRQHITQRSMQDFTQSEIATFIRKHNIDILISYFAPKLEEAVLRAPKLYAINIHPSNLPAYRGGSPLLWQIIGGVRDSAVTAHMLSPEIDCGEILYKETYIIPDGVSKDRLFRHVERHVSNVILNVLGMISEGAMDSGTPQTLDSPTAYAYNVRRENITSKIPWLELSGRSLFNLVSYLGTFPIELAESSVYLSRLPLVADRYLEQPIDKSLGLIQYHGHWYFNSDKGALRLKQSWSPILIFRHWRTFRAHRKGRLKNAYI